MMCSQLLSVDDCYAQIREKPEGKLGLKREREEGFNYSVITASS
ncbi:hypothetical protein HMPREF3214_00053 [Alloscardovia omnicolens]|nr:hypothetical protein HMPREF3214_00053 [Alloscardovia omnicolens]